MTRESINERRLRLWKARQEAEGYDVSNVHTLAEAERYFDNPIIKEHKFGEATVIDGATTTVQVPVDETQNILDNINNSNDNTIPVKPLEELSFKELQDIGKTLGLQVVGVKKDVLIANINNARQEAPAVPQAAEAPVVPQVTFTDEDVTGSTEVTEEVVQAVATAIQTEAQETDKTVEAVVNEIVEEGTEPTTTEEPTENTSIEEIVIPDELPMEEVQNVSVQPE